MEQDREIDQVLMKVRGTTGSMISMSLFSARISFQLIVFLMRMAKKGLAAAGCADKFKSFMVETEGKYTIYNIPLRAGRAEKLKEMNELELELEQTKHPLEKAVLRRELKKLQKEMPELEQLKKLGIQHCLLPKLNGSEQTMQVAVAKRDDQMFKNWFLNHLMTELTGGKKEMEDIKVFTEGNYTIFNLPFEGKELEDALFDFGILGVNYTVLPDLKVGDGNSQIAVPNADRGKLETWFTMWKDKQLREGKNPGELYAMEQGSYMATGQMEDQDYVKGTEPEYQEANAEFEKQSQKVPWSSKMQKENSEEYVKLLQDHNYERITINKGTLVDNMAVSEKAAEMKRNGYFISRVPGTYKDSQKTLILPLNQVFSTDDGKTYLAFLPKNQKTLVADSAGKVSQSSFQDAYEPYDMVNRNLHGVENLKKGVPLKKEAVQQKTPLPAQQPKVSLLKGPKL